MNNTREKLIKTLMLYSDVNEGIIIGIDSKSETIYSIKYNKMILSKDKNRLILYTGKEEDNSLQEAGVIFIDKLRGISIYTEYIEIVLSI